MITVKPVYNSLGYNEFPLITKHVVSLEHRSHRFLYEMIGYNENPLLTNEFSETHNIKSISL
jgi:hypothetical protein